MSKTFLQLATALAQEVDNAGPTTVIGQTGDLKRLVDWLVAADEEVQQQHDSWKFMVGDFTLDTVSGDGSYAASDCVTPVTNLRDWKRPSLKIYLSSSGVGGESRLTYVDYQYWYERYNTGTQTSGRPAHFTIGNDMSIKLGPKPDAVYRISGEYYKSVTSLAANTDVPVYPSEYHMLPVYGAMMKYGRYNAAGEAFQDGSRLYNQLMRRMERNQLSRVLQGGPLA